MQLQFIYQLRSTVCYKDELTGGAVGFGSCENRWTLTNKPTFDLWGKWKEVQ